MKITFDSGLVRKFKVGDPLPTGPKIVKVEWDVGDIMPNRQAFEEYMRNSVQPCFADSKVRFTAETGRIPL